MSDWSFKRKSGYNENWPTDDKGEPESPVFVEHLSGGPLDVEMTVNLLEAYGIPTLTQYPNNGEFANVMLGYAPAGVDLFVPDRFWQDALNLLSATILEDDDQ